MVYSSITLLKVTDSTLKIVEYFDMQIVFQKKFLNLVLIHLFMFVIKLYFNLMFNF